uniref:Uncharacterized protein n=1 Tax=Oryza brachyantha TaxID=4533 RepID=J3MQ10_ORYBR
MAKGRLRTPAPTMAVTLWKAEYHHLAFLDDVIGSQSSIFFSCSVRDLLVLEAKAKYRTGNVQCSNKDFSIVQDKACGPCEEDTFVSC